MMRQHVSQGLGLKLSLALGSVKSQENIPQENIPREIQESLFLTHTLVQLLDESVIIWNGMKV